MTLELDYELGGLPVRVSCADAAFARAFERILPPNASSAHGGPRVCVGRYSDPAWQVDTEARGQDPFDLLPSGLTTPVLLASHLTEWTARTTRRFDGFHAAAVSRYQCVAMIPAASTGGKSTLTAALAQRGFAVYSDELVLLDRVTGKATAYPRSIGLRPDVLELLHLPRGAERDPASGTVFFQPASLGAGVAEASLPVGVILRVHREGGELVRPWARAEAARALMESAVAIPDDPAAVVDRILTTVRGADCFELDASDLSRACEELERRLMNPRCDP